MPSVTEQFVVECRIDPEDVDYMGSEDCNFHINFSSKQELSDFLYGLAIKLRDRYNDYLQNKHDDIPLPESTFVINDGIIETRYLISVSEADDDEDEFEAKLSSFSIFTWVEYFDICKQRDMKNWSGKPVLFPPPNKELQENGELIVVSG